ncbi:hypothetical protein MBLNU457_7363t2 [Dothideomycetes sp. NU457]
MAPLTFEGLSPELKAQIIGKITRPTDLKNVCLVSKACHEIAVRYLYHTVTLSIGGPNDGRLAAFLNPNNKGLQHLRAVCLELAKIDDICKQDQMADVMVRMIVSSIPRDVLEEFDWCHWTKFSLDSLLILHERQRRMKVLQALTVDKPDGLAKSKVDSIIFPRCKTLELFIDTRESLDMAQSFLEKFPLVEDINLHAHFKDSSITTRELNDAPTVPGLITRTLFKHLLPFETCTPLAHLTALSLRELNLKQSSDTYAKVFDFSKLTKINLQQCVGTDALLSNLCKAQNLPQRLERLEIQCKDTEEDVISSLDVLLCLVTGLERLTLDLDKVIGALPSVDGIVKHGKTLKILNVHGFKEVTSDEELFWPVKDFRKLCIACPNLEQLSCAFPPTAILSGAPSLKWRSFATAITTSMKSLVTLQISNWPGYQSNQKKLPYTPYHHLLRGLAQIMFELPNDADLMEQLADDPTKVLSHVPATDKHESKLRLITFGMCNITWRERDDDRDKMALFYRSKQLLLDSRKYVPVAVPVEFYAAKYIEPRCEVLNYYYNHDVEMPINKSGRHSWSSEDEDDDEDED